MERIDEQLDLYEERLMERLDLFEERASREFGIAAAAMNEEVQQLGEFFLARLRGIDERLRAMDEKFGEMLERHRKLLGDCTREVP